MNFILRVLYDHFSAAVPGLPLWRCNLRSFPAPGAAVWTPYAYEFYPLQPS